MGGAVVIAVVNHKGGCAKTTTAVNLASALAVGNEEMGIDARRVLLVDLDPKGNVATTFGIDKKSLGPTMNELFKGGVDGAPVSLNECLLGPDRLTEAMRSPGSCTTPSASADRRRESRSRISGCSRPTSISRESRSTSRLESVAKTASSWHYRTRWATSTLS